MSRKLLDIVILITFAVLPPAVQAQIEEVGSMETLEIATWNIEWFGEDNNGPINEDLQRQNAGSVIGGSGIDLWALQEIADEAQFNALKAELGDHWSSVLAEISSGQATAFLFDTRTVTLRSSTQILTNFSYEFANRPPLKTEFNVSLPDTSFILTAVNVHKKAFADVESWQRRVDASTRVKSHLDFLHPNDTVVFLGDFNDELEGSTLAGRDSPYRNFVDDSDDYFPVTLDLERTGVNTYCNSSLCTEGSSIDHIIVSTEFLPLLETSRTDRLTSALSINGFTLNTSDHLPVYAVFRDFIALADERLAEIPVRRAITDVFPNPFASTVTAVVETTASTDVDVHLVDALGRIIASESSRSLSPGKHEFQLHPGDVPVGVYFLRIASSERVETLPVVKAGR